MILTKQKTVPRKYDKQIHLYLKPEEIQKIDEYLKKINFRKTSHRRISRSQFMKKCVFDFIDRAEELELLKQEYEQEVKEERKKKGKKLSIEERII